MKDETVPESLREVWAWKERVAGEMAGMTPQQRADYLEEGLREFEKQAGFKLPVAGKPRREIEPG
jgi:hypothetical protein